MPDICMGELYHPVRIFGHLGVTKAGGAVNRDRQGPGESFARPLVCPGLVVEMGGVEPPSRNFRDGYTTGIVETLCFAAGTVLDYLPWTLVG